MLKYYGLLFKKYNYQIISYNKIIFHLFTMKIINFCLDSTVYF